VNLHQDGRYGSVKQIVVRKIPVLVAAAAVVLGSFRFFEAAEGPGSVSGNDDAAGLDVGEPTKGAGSAEMAVCKTAHVCVWVKDCPSA